jgi:hypothetical protein
MWEFAEWEWDILEREGETLKEWWQNHLKGTKALKIEGMKGFKKLIEQK